MSVEHVYEYSEQADNREDNGDLANIQNERTTTYLRIGLAFV